MGFTEFEIHEHKTAHRCRCHHHLATHGDWKLARGAILLPPTPAARSGLLCTKNRAETNFGDGIVSELFRKHLQQTNQRCDVEEVRATVRKEDRIIDSLEPVLNQHRLVIDKSVIEWDFRSNPDEAPERRLMYMLFYQMSRMCREKGAVKHDDRIDCLAQGVKYFTDAMGISAQEAIKERKRMEWNQMLAEFIDDPQSSANHMVLGMNYEQRQQAKGDTKNSVPNWV